MEDWQKNFFEIVEAVALMVDEFFVGVTEIVEAFSEQVQNTMATEIDECLQGLFEPITDSYSEFEQVDDEVDLSFTYTLDPTPEKHPACVGCRNYHGQVYGGNLLVCAMHPHGWDDENCPDWESTWRGSSNSPKSF